MVNSPLFEILFFLYVMGEVCDEVEGCEGCSLLCSVVAEVLFVCLN